MVKKIVLNCERLLRREQAHLYLAQMLDFPDYYGENLDALFDCLTEIGECTIVLEGEADFRNADSYVVKVLGVLEEAARANPNLRLEIRKGETLTETD